jgi:hypothetical protein
VPELTTFLDRVGHEAIAVSLTSKAGMKPGDYVEVLERQWAAQELDRGGDGRGVEAPTVPERRRPTRSRVSSPPSPRRRVTRPARPQLAMAVGLLAGLMMVLLGLGLD